MIQKMKEAIRNEWASDDDSKIINFLSRLTRLFCFNKISVTGRNNILITNGVFYLKSRILIKGSNNRVIIGKGTRLDHTNFIVQGHNVTITIGRRNYLGHTKFFVEDDYSNLTIGEENIFGHNNHVAVTEGTKISFKNKCLMAQNVTFRSGDSHGIFDKETKQRINTAQNVTIGNRVWFGYNTTVLKGVEIKDDTIVATGSTVIKSPEESNVILGGIPAKIVKRKVYWTPERNNQ